MKLEDIFSEAEKDLVLDATELSVASTDTPILFNKWNKIFTLERITLKGLEGEYEAKVAELNDYYGGHASDDVYKQKPLQRKVLKGDIEKFLTKDLDYIRLKTRLDLQKEKVEAVGRIMVQINDRKWVIKNIIEREKFLNGG